MCLVSQAVRLVVTRLWMGRCWLTVMSTVPGCAYTVADFPFLLAWSYGNDIAYCFVAGNAGTM